VTHETANKIANVIGNVKPEDVLRALNEYNKNDEPMRAYDVANAIYHDDKLDVDEQQVTKALKALDFGKEDIAYALDAPDLGLNLADEYVVEAMHEAGFSVPEIIEAMNSKDGCDLDVSRIARALSDAGFDRLTIIRGFQEVDGDLEIPHILEKDGILDVEDRKDVYELVQEMDKAGEDSYSIAKKLKEFGVSNDNMAYAMFRGLDLDGPDLIGALASEDGADLDFNEVAAALRDGLEWSESDIAKAFYNFNKGDRALSQDEAVIETAKILKDGLDCSAAEVAEAIYDATYSDKRILSNGVDVQALNNAFDALCVHDGPFGMEIEDAVQVMREKFSDVAIESALTTDPDLGGMGYSEEEAEKIMGSMDVKKEAVELIKGGPIEAERAIRLLEDKYGIKPDAEYEAAAGRSYGWVKVWEVNDDLYIIQNGNDAESGVHLASDASDLAEWLEFDDVHGLDKLVQTANVRGADHVPEADETVSGPYFILETKHFYGAAEENCIVTDKHDGPLEFETIDEAKEWIGDVENWLHYSAHNESGRPSYKIVVDPDQVRQLQREPEQQKTTITRPRPRDNGLEL
jgi:hypothetical protein